MKKSWYLTGGILTAALFVLLTGCGEKQEEYEYTPVTLRHLDADNSRNTAEWSHLPFLKQEDKERGYIGGENCQHLTSITRSESNPDLMYLGTDAAGVYRSRDGGNTWETINRGLFTKGVGRIEVDPMNDSHVVLSNTTSSEDISKYSSLCYSFDGGNNWHKSGNSQLGFSASQYYYDTMEFDKASFNPTLGYCTDVYYSTPLQYDWSSKLKNDDDYAIKRGIHRSRDGGVSFEKIGGTDNLCDAVLIVDGGKIVAANYSGIFLSLNGGSDGFTQVSSLCVYSLEQVNGVYYALTSDGIYKGENISNLEKVEYESFAGYSPRNLAVSPSNPDNMVMVAMKRRPTSDATNYSERPYFSTDGGKNWTLAELTTADQSGIFYYYTFSNGIFTFDPRNENEVVGLSGGIVMRSHDGGANWVYSSSGINNVSLGGKFNFNVYDPNLMYVGALDFGGALTTDGGKTWQNISLSKDGDGKDIFGGYAADPDTLFGAYCDSWTDGAYFRDYRYVCFSHDGGKTVNIDSALIKNYWNQTPRVGPPEYAKWRVDPTIVTGGESSYQSPNHRNVLFCCNYRSTDYGYTWESMTSKGCLQVYTHSGRALFGCSKESGFVMRSDDDGATWMNVNAEELPKAANQKVSHIEDIAIDSKNGYIYAVYGNRLFRMNLNGTGIKNLTTNKMYKNNYGTVHIRSVAVDARCPEVVYVGGSGDFYFDADSVRRSCDSGETWVTVTCSNSAYSVMKSDPVRGFEARCLRVAPSGKLWCGTLCLGFCTLTPPYKI